jgi:hypothetical protein
MYFNFGKKYSVNIIFAEYRSIFWLDYHSYLIKNEKFIYFLGLLCSGPPKVGSGPGKKKKIGPGKGVPVKNLYTKSERGTLSCRVTWAWSEEG